MRSNNIGGGRALIITVGITALVLLLAGGAGATQEQNWTVKPNGSIVEIYYGSVTNSPQYAALNTSSCYFRMVSPGSTWGSSIILCPSFWENGTPPIYIQGYPVNYTPQFEGSDLVLTLNGSVSNLTANISLRIHPPSNNTISANVEANVIGNLQLANNHSGEAFKPVMLSSMHISTDQWDASTAYVGATIYPIPSEGWIVNQTPPFVNSDVFGLVGGTSNWQIEHNQTNAPTVEIHLNNSYQVTGWVTSSSNPNDDNVSFWAASNNLVRTWEYTIAVRTPVLASITISPVNPIVSVSRTQTFNATAKDQNDNPMAGIDISWTSSNPSVGTVSPSSAMTDKNGTATTTFTALAPGTTMVNATNGTVSGSVNVNVNVVTVPTFNISGFKINASSGSGIPDWNITVKNATMQKSMLTDTDGSYKFTDLVNGTYNVSEEMKPGFTPVGATFRLISIENMDVTNVNFTNTPMVVIKNGSISGMKFNDLNGNGIKNPGEPGLVNWTIVLKDSTGATIATTLTTSDGSYKFSNLSAGNYTVEEILKPGWIQTAPKPLPPETYTVTITSAGEDITGKDFGNMLPPPPPTVNGSISGFKINADNGMGLPSWNIKLIGIGAETVGINMETTTDTNGFYSFGNLPAGMYLLVETLRGDYVPTGSPVIVVNLEKGTNSMNNNFMNNRPVSSLIPDLSGMFR